MINLTTFNKCNGIVLHNLNNDWSWEKIEKFCAQQVNKDPAYYRELGNGGYTVGGVSSDAYVNSVLDFLHPLEPTFQTRAGLYVSTTGQSKSFPLHNDPGQHLWIWQVLGDTLWQVGNEYLTLSQNDLLYILPGVQHRAIPDSPRASITLSLDEFI